MIEATWLMIILSYAPPAAIDSEVKATPIMVTRAQCEKAQKEIVYYKRMDIVCIGPGGEYFTPPNPFVPPPKP